MKTVTEHLRHHILSYLGVERVKRGTGDDLEAIAEQQIDWRFLEAMANRLIMGWYRYGDNRNPKLPRHDHVLRMRQCIDRYLATGNLEQLVDLANFCMLEWMKAPLGRGTLDAHQVHWHAIDDAHADPELHATELEKKRP